MNTRLSILLVPVAAMLLASAVLVHATAFRWVDEHGRVHYSDTMPAGQARLGYAIYDAHGRQIKVVEPAKTEAERVAAQQQVALAVEHERRDRVLLATFTSEDDLEVARGERLAGLDAALALEQEKLAELQQQQTALEAQVASYEAEQEGVPVEEAATRLESVQASIIEIQASLTVKQAQKQVVEEAFTSDLARYRELKGLPAP